MPETKKLRRNAPCHCGSGKKYKQCHLAQDEAERVANLNRQAEIAHLQAHNDDYVPPDPSEADPRERRKKGKTTLMGSFWVLLFLAAAMVLFLMVLNPGSQGTPDLPAAERSAPAGTPQPPGPAPEGKVWSPEHGHWHDAPE